MNRRDLGSGFSIIKNAIILQFDSEKYKSFYTIIDFETFEVIKSNGSSFHYFKDKNNVYIDSYMGAFMILTDANPNNFEILDFENGFSTSQKNHYHFGNKLPYSLSEINSVNGLYCQVNESIYFNYSKLLNEVDLASFVVLKANEVSNVAKDKNHVYFRDEIVGEADSETFSFLNECFENNYYRECDHTFYAKDKKYAYYIDTIAKSFKIIKSKSLNKFRFEIKDQLGYAFDDEYSYLFGKRTRLKDKI